MLHQCTGPVLTYDINITIALLKSLFSFQTNINFHKKSESLEKEGKVTIAEVEAATAAP